MSIARGTLTELVLLLVNIGIPHTGGRGGVTQGVN